MTILYNYPYPLNLSEIQRELGLSKPTISKTVKLLSSKKLINIIKQKKEKKLTLTLKGTKIIEKIEKINNLFVKIIEETSNEQIYYFFFQLINNLYSKSLVSLINMCKNCYFFEKKEKEFYCNFLKKKLEPKDLKIVCMDWKNKK